MRTVYALAHQFEGSIVRISEHGDILRHDSLPQLELSRRNRLRRARLKGYVRMESRSLGAEYRRYGEFGENPSKANQDEGQTIGIPWRKEDDVGRVSATAIVRGERSESDDAVVAAVRNTEDGW